MKKGGTNGPALVPGKADASLLFTLAAHRVEPVMPPRDNEAAKPLTPDELGLLKHWIDAGARDDSSTTPHPSEPRSVELGELPPGLHPINAVDMTANGARVAAGRANVVQVYDVDSGLAITSLGGHRDLIQSIRFSPDGHLLAAGSFRLVTLWTEPQGGSRTTPAQWTLAKSLESPVNRVLAIDFSPDGKRLATGGGEPSRSGEVKLFEVATGTLLRSLDTLHSDTVFALRFSPDGSKLASAAGDKFVKVTNVADGKLLRSFEGHTGHVMAVDWRSDSKQLASAGADGVIKVWDFDSGDQVRTLQPVGKQITAVRWLVGKPEIVGASGDSQVRIWNPDNGGISRVFGGLSDYVYSVAASADGGRVAAGGADGVLFIWDGRNGQVLKKLEAPAVAKPKAGAARTAAVR
jgi:WD40 repeat protein